MTDDPSARQGPPGNEGAEGPLLGTEPAVSSPASYRMTDWGTLRYAFSVFWHNFWTIILLGLFLGILSRVGERLIRLFLDPLHSAVATHSEFVAGFLYAAAVAWVGAPFATGYHYAILGLAEAKEHPFERAFAAFRSGRAFVGVLGAYGCFTVLFAAGRQLAHTAIPWEYLFGDGGPLGADMPGWAVNSLYHGVPRALGMLLALPLLWAALDAVTRKPPVAAALRHSVSLASLNPGLTAMMAATLVLMCVLPVLLGMVFGVFAATVHSVFYREMVWRERESETAAAASA